MLQNCSIFGISAFKKKFQPVLTFGAFFQCDVKLCNEVSFPVSIKSFSNICADTGTGAHQLICQDRLFFVTFNFITQSYDLFEKVFPENGVVYDVLNPSTDINAGDDAGDDIEMSDQVDENNGSENSDE